MLKTAKTLKKLGRKCISHLKTEKEFLERYFVNMPEEACDTLVSSFEFEEKKRDFLRKAGEIQSARMALKREINECQPNIEPTIAELAKILDTDLQAQLEAEHRRVLELTRSLESKQL